MSVTVDREPLAAEQMGMETVGQVLAHIHKDKRLIVSLLIDGQEPDLDHLPKVRQSALLGRTVFIETADCAKMAIDVLNEVGDQLAEGDRLRGDAVELLQRGQANRAMEKLSGCFGAWQTAQESVLKIAQLLRIDLETMYVADRPLTALLTDFAAQLRQIKISLEQRDFVALCDILTYEAHESSAQWRAALVAIRECVAR